MTQRAIVLVMFAWLAVYILTGNSAALWCYGLSGFVRIGLQFHEERIRGRVE